MARAPIRDIDFLFDRVRTYAVDDEEGWNPTSRLIGCGLARRELPDGTSLLRAQFDLDIPFEDLGVFMRPEVFLNQRRPEYDSEIAECGIEELIAPGNAVAWTRVRVSPIVQRFAALANGVGLRVGRLVDGEATNPWSKRHRIRMAIRTDFPVPGKHSLVAAPLDPDTSEILEEWGIMTTAIGIGEPHPTDPSKSRIKHCMQNRRMSTLLVPLAVGTGHMGIWQWIARYRTSPLKDDVTSGSESYMIIGIRRYQRGPPLLPAEDGEDCPSGFVHTAAQGFTLPVYLRSLVCRIGLRLEIYGSLDCRRLVPYQAAVQRGAWEANWEALGEAWRVQRAAYRRLLGGTNAPELSQGIKPRFLPADDVTLAAPPLQAGCAELRIPEVQTFVHFSARPSLPRCGSEPTIEVPTGVLDG